MKKFFSFFAAALMAVSMFAESITLDFYDAEKLTATSGTNLTTDNYAQFVKVPDGKQASDYVSGIATTGTIRFGMNGGLTFGTGTAADDQLTITLATGVKVKKVTAYATLYDSGIFYLNNVKGTGTMGTKNSAIESVTSPLVWEDLSASSLVFSKKTNDSKAANCKRVTLLRVICEIEGGESSTDPELNVANTLLLESNATEGAITYTISNPVAETAVVPTCTAEWISNLANDATNNKVTFTTTANEGAERTATVTLTYGSIVKEVAVTQKKYVKDYTSLPMTAAAGLSSAQVKELDGVTLVCDGTDYNNATNKVKMSKNTHYLQVKTDARPGVCTFSLKGAAGAGTSSFTLQGSADGTAWTDVETLSATFAAQNEVVEVKSTKEFAEDVRYVKLAFNKATNEVNCGLGAFSIAEYVAPALTLSMAKTEETITITPSDLNAKYYVAVLEPSLISWAYYTKEQKLAMYANVVAGVENQAALEAKLVSGVQTITLADYTTEGYYQLVAGAMHYDSEAEGNINGFVLDSEVAAEDFTIEKQVITTTFSFADGEQGVVTITPSNNDQDYIYVYCNEALLGLFPIVSTEEGLIDFILASAEDLSPIMLKGVQTVDIAEYAGLEGFGLTLPNGTYNLLVAAVEYDEEGEYYSIVGDIARHEGVVVEVEYPEFKGNPDFQKKGFSVKDIVENEDYYVSYMFDAENYEQYSTMFSDEDMLNNALELPDYEWTVYRTLGQTVVYSNYEYFDTEATENADYVILIANADAIMTGMVNSKAVKYYITLSPEGELVSIATGINNAEVENLGKMIVNGELVIVKDGVRYNVLGARK